MAAIGINGTRVVLNPRLGILETTRTLKLWNQIHNSQAWALQQRKPELPLRFTYLKTSKSFVQISM